MNFRNPRVYDEMMYNFLYLAADDYPTKEEQFQETFQVIGIAELSVSPSAVLPLRAEIRKSIVKTCILEKLGR